MSLRLRVDPIACDGRGVCAELLPEVVTTDAWGYPIIDERPVPAHLEAQARDAVASCPLLALRLETLAPRASSDPDARRGRRSS